MSSTPPLSSPPHPSTDAVDTVAGDGVTLTVDQARGARRTGAIWILVVSLVLAIVVLGAYWLSQAPRMQAVNHPSGRDLNAQDVRKMYPTQAQPPAAPSTAPN